MRHTVPAQFLRYARAAHLRKVLCLSLVTITSRPAMCQAGADTSTRGAAVVHRFMPGVTLIEHGDTLTWLADTVRAGKVHTDTSGFVFDGDRATRVRPGAPIPVSATLAGVLRDFLQKAREQDALQRKLGISL